LPPIFSRGFFFVRYIVSVCFILRSFVCACVADSSSENANRHRRDRNGDRQHVDVRSGDDHFRCDTGNGNSRDFRGNDRVADNRNNVLGNGVDDDLRNRKYDGKLVADGNVDDGDGDGRHGDDRISISNRKYGNGDVRNRKYVDDDADRNAVYWNGD